MCNTETPTATMDEMIYANYWRVENRIQTDNKNYIHFESLQIAWNT